MIATITVKKRLDKTTKSGNKQYVSVVDEGGTWFNVWDLEIAANIAEGQQYSVEFEQKGDFRNITGFATDPTADIFADVAVPTTKPEVKLSTNGMQELRLLVQERQHAFHMAVLLAAAGKVQMSQIKATADQALDYYRKTESPAAPIVTPASSENINPEDYIR